MNTHAKRWTLIAAMAAMAGAGLAPAADDPGMGKDLTSTIALLGLPCGQVVSSVRQGSNDYVATCKDKNRYRVFLNPQGKVVAQKQ